MNNRATKTQSINTNEVCGSESDGQYVDEIEEQCDLQQLQQELPIGEQQFQGKVLPTLIISLAQKLMPVAVQRLNRRDVLRREQVWGDTDDDFTGMCEPLGNSSEIVSPASTEIINANNHNLKTTGLEDELINNSVQQQQQQQPYSMQHQSDLEMGDPTKYLPESAALLISALNHSSQEKPSKCNANTSNSNHSPSLLDGVLNDEAEANGEHRSFDNFELEAEALLRSIRDETKKEVTTSPHASNNFDVIQSFDDDDSICGDMVRLTNSIAYLQQDLENVDMSHLDDLYEDQFSGFGDEGNAWSRMKLWFSRGMIMEQKLLHSVGIGSDDQASGVDTTTRDRYVDNPVLIWSLAIMWAFVLLIMGHSHIAEWVEGEDPGRLADFLEWIFM